MTIETWFVFASNTYKCKINYYYLQPSEGTKDNKLLTHMCTYSNFHFIFDINLHFNFANPIANILFHF